MARAPSQRLRFVLRCAPLLSALGVVPAACDEARMKTERATLPRSDRGTAVKTTELQAGPTSEGPTVTNPYAGNVHALREGEQLFEWFNCAGCHGVLGGGGMGVPLADESWIYGDSPAQIRQSIVQGRPNGMPAYGDRIGNDQLWKLVAFVSFLRKKAIDESGADNVQ